MSSRVAIVDGGSFVLPYDFQLANALVRGGIAQVDFYGSATKYNAEFLDAMRLLPGVEMKIYTISGSVAGRITGVMAYCALLFRLWQMRKRYDVINFQFSILWPLELPLLFLLRKKFIFTIHNAVPHDHSGRYDLPTRWLARIAKTLIFPSNFTRNEFFHRYGRCSIEKSMVLPHGLLPVAPNSEVVEYQCAHQPQSLIFWSTVKPYKGVELFATLARSEALRSRGLTLEIYGAWSAELKELKAELVELGVQVHDEFMGPNQLLSLLSRKAIFLLPYLEASQSGALYSLLNHGCYFICSDVGDLGGFMRESGLDSLLLTDRSAEAVLCCLDYLLAHGEDVRRRFELSQWRFKWESLIPQISSVYGVPP